MAAKSALHEYDIDVVGDAGAILRALKSSGVGVTEFKVGDHVHRLLTTDAGWRDALSAASSQVLSYGMSELKSRHSTRGDRP